MLLSCDRGSFLGLHSCTHSQDAGVRCPGQYRKMHFSSFHVTVCIDEIVGGLRKDDADMKHILYIYIVVY